MEWSNIHVWTLHRYSQLFSSSRKLTERIKIMYPAAGPNSFNLTFILSDQPAVKTFSTGSPANTLKQGATVNVTCIADGYPPPTYIIKRGNQVVNSTGGRFVITNIQLSEEDYTYSCTPNNTVGTGAAKTLKITVLGENKGPMRIITIYLSSATP